MTTFSRISFVAVILMVVSAPILAQFGGGRGGRGGGGRGGRGGFDSEAMEEMRDRMETVRTCPMELMWTVISFEMDLTDGQRAPLRAALAQIWTQRRGILAFGQEHELWDEAKRKMKDLDKQTKSTLKSMMEKDQWKAFEKAFKSLAKQTRVQSPRGR